MKILIIERHPSYNIFLPDIKEAFEKNGNICQIIKSDISDEIIKNIKIFQPHYLFTITIFPDISKIALNFKIPVIHYELDKIMNITYFDETLYSDYDIIFTTYKDDVKKFKNVKVKNIFYLPFAYNIKHHNLSNREYKFNLSFVGSLLYKINNDYKKYIQILTEQIRQVNDINLWNLFKKYIQILNKILFIQFEYYTKKNEFKIPELIEKYFRNFDDLLNNFLVNKEILINLISKEAAYQQRLFFISNLDEINVFGNNDWAELKLPNLKYHGFIDGYTGASKIYYETKINLDITRIYQLDGFSDRIFNVLYSQGFLLVNRSDAILELFEDKKEIVTYQSLEELKDLINYYLQNETAREQIAKNGYEKTVSEHSFINRTKYILEVSNKITGYNNN
ncbi:MAG TPA: glycosyltransferase [bacterium]|nr:glycosyltransferase [bacterium]HOL47173.1 glycosyltransferase [bacterium]HPQ17666.1 glycosyltransferase [bacterium]